MFKFIKRVKEQRRMRKYAVAKLEEVKRFLEERRNIYNAEVARMEEQSQFAVEEQDNSDINAWLNYYTGKAHMCADTLSRLNKEVK